jgi:hypothetical protein
VIRDAKVRRCRCFTKRGNHFKMAPKCQGRGSLVPRRPLTTMHRDVKESPSGYGYVRDYTGGDLILHNFNVIFENIGCKSKELHLITDSAACFVTLVVSAVVGRLLVQRVHQV